MTLLVPPSSALRPELRRPLEHFVQAAFGVLAMDVSSGQEVSFALGGGGGAAGPRLYDYRPLYPPTSRSAPIGCSTWPTAARRSPRSSAIRVSSPTPRRTRRAPRRPAEALRRVGARAAARRRRRALRWLRLRRRGVRRRVRGGRARRDRQGDPRLRVHAARGAAALEPARRPRRGGDPAPRVARRDRRALARVVRARARRLRPRAGRSCSTSSSTCASRRASSIATPRRSPGTP